MRVHLVQYLDRSTITLLDTRGWAVGWIRYAQPSHKYRSSTDYQTLRTELATYGHRAVTETFHYLAAARNRVSA